MGDDGKSRASVTGGGGAGEDEDAERRLAFRRRLPFGRGAVLMVGKRAHVVAVADLSVIGAYLTTRARLAAGERHVLKLLVMPDRTELLLPVEVVRVSQAEHESTTHPRGVAVRFVDIDEAMRRHLEGFVARRPAGIRR